MNLDPLTPQARAIRDWLTMMFFATRREEILMSPKDLKREIFLKQGSLPDDYIINAVKELKGVERWKDNGKAATRKYSYHRIIETAHDWRLYEFRVSHPGRPFVFRRADFIDDNTWSRSAAFEQQNKPGREAITRTTMPRNRSLEKLTKANLVRRVQELMHQNNVLETQKERIKEEYNAAVTEREQLRESLEVVKKDREKFMRSESVWHSKVIEANDKVITLTGERDLLLKDKNEVDRMYVSVTTRNTELEQELHRVNTDLRIARAERNDYRKWWDTATEERDRARKALEHQALGLGRLTEHMEPRELVSMTATDTSN